MQHDLLPTLARRLLLFDASALDVRSPVWLACLGSVLVFITIPELIVSLRLDLLRPYPLWLPQALTPLRVV